MNELVLSDAAMMRVMAHPIRMRIVGSLRVDGPATSAILARRLDTDSGQTSHHLRLLARHGFVTDAPELGEGNRGRERWWRASHRTTLFEPGTHEDNVAIERTTREAWGAWIDAYYRQVAQRRWTPEWQRVASSRDYVIHTTPQQLEDLQQQIGQLVQQARTKEPGAEQVLIVLQTYPHRAS